MKSAKGSHFFAVFLPHENQYNQRAQFKPLRNKRTCHLWATTFADYLETLKQKFPEVSFDYFQSNIEGELIDELHRVGFSANGIILNAAAYHPHFSRARRRH